MKSANRIYTFHHFDQLNKIINLPVEFSFATFFFSFLSYCCFVFCCSTREAINVQKLPLFFHTKIVTSATINFHLVIEYTSEWFSFIRLFVFIFSCHFFLSFFSHSLIHSFIHPSSLRNMLLSFNLFVVIIIFIFFQFQCPIFCFMFINVHLSKFNDVVPQQ